MAKTSKRAYSRYSQDAVALLGALVRTTRTELGMTAQQLAERAGISRGLLQRIEKGDLKCEIGAAFEVAAIVGIRLFDSNETALTYHVQGVREKLTLLPKSVRNKTRTIDDDF